MPEADLNVLAEVIKKYERALWGRFTWEKFAKSKTWKLLKARLSGEEEQEFKAVCLANEPGDGESDALWAFQELPGAPESNLLIPTGQGLFV